MAITYVTQTAVDADTAATLSTTLPASIASGDLLVMIIGMKPSTANSGSTSTPSGWTAQGSIVGAGGYGTTLGADTGNTNLFVLTRVADGSEDGSTVNVSVTNSNVAWTQTYQLSNATGSWDVAVVTGSDTSGGNVSITFDTSPGIETDDYAIAAMCIPTDVTTPSQFVSQLLTASGATFGIVTEVSEPDSALGNDIGGFVVRAAVSTGSSSAAPSMTATAVGTTTNVRGPGVFIRLREVAAAPFDITDVFRRPRGANYRR